MAGRDYTWPGYNYLGPGNDIYREDEVVNSIDFVPYVHDLEYTLATREEDIGEADRQAIRSFIKDFRENGRLADIAGIIGLGVKYGVESVFGVQYPSMSKDNKNLKWSNFLFAERERHISHLWKVADKSKFVNYQEFKASSEIKRLYEEYRPGGHYYKQLHADWTARNPNKIVKEKPAQEVQAGPSNKRPPDSGSNPDTDSSKFPRLEETSSNPDSSIQNIPLTPETATILENILAGFDTGNISEGADRASEASEAILPMDIDPNVQSGSSRGPNVGARSGASGINPVAGAKSGSVSDLTWIRPSQPASTNKLKFTKTRILISYGYSTENIQLGSPDLVENITTSMALVPVDYLPFYLSHSEFEGLPNGSAITDVECKVTPLGTRTAFDTGTSLSGTATSEYVPIGLVCEGMNIQFYGRNKEYTVDVTNPMKPTSVKAINPVEMAKKYYQHVGCNALCVPQNINEYFVHEWNRSANPDPNKYPKYMVHNYGVARMDQKVHQFLLNQSIGQEIVHYTYKFKDGTIKTMKDHFVPWNRNNNAVETTYTRPRSMVLQFFEMNNKPALGDVGLGKDKDYYTVINQVQENYYRKIENYGAFHPGRGATPFAAQPQLHIGLVATPQLNPATNNTSYLNSACYWKIECSCYVTFNLNSAFSINRMISWPLEVTFIQNASQKYTDGQCLFGNTDTGSGNVEMENSDDESTTDDNDSDFTFLSNKANQLKV